MKAIKRSCETSSLERMFNTVINRYGFNKNNLQMTASVVYSCKKDGEEMTYNGNAINPFRTKEKKINKKGHG